MSNRLSYCPARQPLPVKRQKLIGFLTLLVCAFALVPSARAHDEAPAWMHNVVSAPLPPHDEKDNTAVLYSERTVNVLSVDKIIIHVREAYKILRPFDDAGIVGTSFNAQDKITSIRAWCIPASGKDYEVKEKDSVEVALPKIDGSELISDVRYKVLRVPAAEPGNIIGYEYEMETQPLVLEDSWYVEQESPARERRYTFILPSGWQYKASWINHSELKPAQANPFEQTWTVQDVKGVRAEGEMPPFAGVAGHMIVSFIPPGGHATGSFSNWKEMGDWYLNLSSGRRDASPAIKQKVAELTASIPAPLDKMKAIATFVQREVRYVAIELGIGGVQPHPASDVFAHRYGDCKDKATLMSSMLHEIGVESYYVMINSERGSVTPQMPAHASSFNHAILAIRLPQGVSSPSLTGVVQHSRFGRILFFDPTNEIVPFGEIGGYLQDNAGLLVGPEGGEIVVLPQLLSSSNTIQRTATFTLSASGNLEGQVEELRVGDRAAVPRDLLRSATKNDDRIKPIESILANSLSTFKILKAQVVNALQYDQPFGYRYSFTAENYAKQVGNLLAVRPRVLGSKSSSLLETKEPRLFPVEFPGPARDTDTFDITIPPGYVVDDLPAPVDVDFSFASYHSKSEARGNQIHYTRTFEIKELSVPASRAAELKKFYRIIATDERSMAVLRTVSN